MTGYPTPKGHTATTTNRGIDMRQHLIRKSEAYARRYGFLVVINVDSQLTCIWFT